MTQDQDTLESYSDGTMPDHVDLDAADYVRASKYRRAVLRELAGGAEVPSDINDDVEFRFKSVSRALTELRERELIELLVPEEQTHGQSTMTDRYQQAESLIETLNEFEQETGLRLYFKENKIVDRETWEIIAELGYDGEQFTIHRPDDEKWW